jgi:hypothetical protein
MNLYQPNSFRATSYDYKFKDKPCHTRSRSNNGNVMNKICNFEDDYVTRLNFFHPSKQVKKVTSNNYKRNSMIEILKGSSHNTALINEIEATNNAENNLKKISRKIENINFELKNEEKRNTLEKLKQENKRELVNAYTELEILKKELNDLAFETDLLNQRFKIVEDEASRKVRRSLRMTHEEYEMYINVRKNMEYENKRISDQLELISEAVVAKNERIKQLQEEVARRNKDNRRLKDDLVKIKNDLLNHYHDLLAEGKDTRKEGLVWIIKAIWNLGSKVITGYIPKYLDEEGIEYVFDVMINITIVWV